MNSGTKFHCSFMGILYTVSATYQSSDLYFTPLLLFRATCFIYFNYLRTEATILLHPPLTVTVKCLIAHTLDTCRYFCCFYPATLVLLCSLCQWPCLTLWGSDWCPFCMADLLSVSAAPSHWQCKLKQLRLNIACRVHRCLKPQRAMIWKINKLQRNALFFP